TAGSRFMAERVLRVLRSLDRLAGTRRGAALVFAAGLAAYALESLGMPLTAGRGLGNYLPYYDQFFPRAALTMGRVFRTARGAPTMVMLFRRPGASLVVGPALDFLGGWGSQILMGVLFALTVTVWSAVAAEFSRRAATLTAIALVLFPGYGMFFHRISSDQIF